MSVEAILVRSMCGYIFVVPGIILYFSRLTKTGRNQSALHVAASFAFCYYLIGVLTMTGIGKLKSFSPRLVLIPFVDMLNGPADTILNIILFVPLGFFLPLLYKKYLSAGSAVLSGFLVSLAVEIVQMFGRGATDINDLITNTVGTCAGYLIYKLLSKIAGNKFCRSFHANAVSDSVEVLFFASYAFLVMVTIQPMVIHKLFRLG